LDNALTLEDIVNSKKVTHAFIAEVGNMFSLEQELRARA
jgi:hypothetical protein